MRHKLVRMLTLTIAAWALASTPTQAQSSSGSDSGRPLILVHGWGPEPVIGFGRYAQFLVDDGVPKARIHLLVYDFQKDLATINAELTAQMLGVAARYPATTTFDIIGHSTGQFVGLYAAQSSGLISRVVKFIGLSGIGHGWDCGACALGFLGRAEKTLAPAYNPFITQFYQRNTAAVARLDKCSLFSPEDGLIKPYDSGRFVDGVNVRVVGMHHMDSVKKRQYYDLMKERCYGGALPGYSPVTVSTPHGLTRPP